MRKVVAKTSIIKSDFDQAMAENGEAMNKLHQALLKVIAMQMYDDGNLELNIEEGLGEHVNDIYTQMLNLKITGYVYSMNDHFTVLKLLKELNNTELTEEQKLKVNDINTILKNKE